MTSIKWKCKNNILLNLLIASLLLLISVGTQAADDMEGRLNALSEALERKRQELHIPGMALAIIKDDKIILAKGFGYRDLAGKVAVTPDTNFAIGSTSKAFASTLVALLADEGKMGWDEKVSTYMEWFKPNLNEATGELTLRDMLSHRSGLSRNDILWASGVVGREAILRESLDAEPLDEFRKKFNYNNVLYLAAGVASAKASGEKDWDSLLEKRLLKPLHMKSSTSRNAEASNMSKGYRWIAATKTFEALEKKNLDNISPAGGIHSNVLDMANWVRFNLGKGKFDGKQLLSSKQFDDLWGAAISMAPGMDYGLGWFIRDWQGKKVIEHGGNIQGYAAQVALMPEENLGFVLLTNVTATPLQQGSMEIVWDGLFSEEKTQEEEGKVDYTPYIGDYIANFGPFRDATFAVQVTPEGALAVDVPGQRLYALKDPDAKGKWYFQLTNTIAVSFSEVEKGKAKMMRMHQGGMDFEIPRKGVSAKAEVDLAEFSPLLGDYKHPALPRPIKALIKNNRLAIDVPGEMVYELHLPDDKGHRAFRINKMLSAKFDTDEQGAGKTLSIYRGDNKALSAEVDRSTQQKSDPLPSKEDILALMKTKEKIAAFKKAGSTSITANVMMKQAGVKGEMLMKVEGDSRYHQSLNFGQYGQITTVLNGDFAATKGLQPYTEFNGNLLEQAKNEHPYAGIDLVASYDSFKVKEKREMDGKAVYLVELTEEGLPATTIAVDVETGDIVKRRGGMILENIGIIPIVTTYSDFREVNGYRQPYKVNVFNPMSGNMLIEITSMKTNQTFDKSLFTLSQ
ncbi:serine hydrolase [Temperatibacter marinus]|uniref:Serine hydrolase n=1 Tax=Temperatibacter marinus TaxID=1456591 RepID=A0AA52HAN4_9PROT|nr:serine hydrolase [Temperatibacter marinus]WND02930.1 serine hydrolase [Temperatibacter marinus]